MLSSYPISGGGAGGGGSSLSDMDWAAVDGVQGVGTGTALSTSSYQQLSDAEGAGQALLSYSEINSSGLRLTPPTNNAAMTGIVLGDIPNTEDGAVAVRIAHIMQGDGTVNANDNITAAVGIYIYTGTDSSTNAYVGGGVCRNSDNMSTAALYCADAAGGRGNFGVTGGFVTDYARPLGVYDLCVTRDGSTGDVRILVGQYGRWDQIYYSGAHTTAEARVALQVVSSTTAVVDMAVDVHNIAPVGVFAGLPQIS